MEPSDTSQKAREFVFVEQTAVIVELIADDEGFEQRSAKVYGYTEHL